MSSLRNLLEDKVHPLKAWRSDVQEGWWVVLASAETLKVGGRNKYAEFPKWFYRTAKVQKHFSLSLRLQFIWLYPDWQGVISASVLCSHCPILPDNTDRSTATAISFYKQDDRLVRKDIVRRGYLPLPFTVWLFDTWKDGDLHSKQLWLEWLAATGVDKE